MDKKERNLIINYDNGIETIHIAGLLICEKR